MGIYDKSLAELSLSGFRHKMERDQRRRLGIEHAEKLFCVRLCAKRCNVDGSNTRQLGRCGPA